MNFAVSNAYLNSTYFLGGRAGSLARRHSAACDSFPTRAQEIHELSVFFMNHLSIEIAERKQYFGKLVLRELALRARKEILVLLGDVPRVEIGKPLHDGGDFLHRRRVGRAASPRSTKLPASVLAARASSP
jgi:hypothetical protein